MAPALTHVNCLMFLFMNTQSVSLICFLMRDYHAVAPVELDDASDRPCDQDNEGLGKVDLHFPPLPERWFKFLLCMCVSLHHASVQPNG